MKCLSAVNSSSTGYSDVQSGSAYAATVVIWAIQWNIMSTRGPGLIYPQGRVSRTELNSMINNMVGMN